MRRSASIEFVAVSAVPTLLVPSNAARWALYLFPANGIRYTVSDKQSVTLDNGITIPSGVNAIKICRYDTGDFVTKPLYVVASGAGVVGFIQSTDLSNVGDDSDPRLGRIAP